MKRANPPESLILTNNLGPQLRPEAAGGLAGETAADSL